MASPSGFSNPTFTGDLTTADEIQQPDTSAGKNEVSHENQERDLQAIGITWNNGGQNYNKKFLCRQKGTCFYTAIVISVLTAAVGVAMLAGGYDAMFDAILKTQLQVKPGSQAYDIWKDTPVPLSLSFYLFNLTNPEEFQNGAKPRISEVGPYVYQEFHKKTNMTFNENSTVTFYQQRWWVWDQEASGELREDDSICILNTVPVENMKFRPVLQSKDKLSEIVSAAYSVRDSDFLLTGLNSALNDVGETLTPVYSARETLFDGYKDPLLAYVHNLTIEYPNAAFILEELGLPPALLDYDKMAWFYKRNLSETYDGLFNMFTGTDTLDHLGNIDRWNTLNETDYYTSPCNGIFGSAGEIWPPYQTATNISFWCSDMCSTLTLVYKEDTTDEFGLEGYRYWADEKAFASPDLVPENVCFCFDNDIDECPPSGLMDAQTCRMGSPAYISFPHFLHADPSLTAAVDGMVAPDEELDQLYIDMIPELGVPISVRARMQINMQVRPYPGKFGYGRIDLLADVSEVVMPLLWFEVKAGLTEELAAELRPVLFLMRTPTVTVIWIVMVVCGVSGLLFLLLR